MNIFLRKFSLKVKTGNRFQSCATFVINCKRFDEFIWILIGKFWVFYFYSLKKAEQVSKRLYNLLEKIYLLFIRKTKETLLSLELNFRLNVVDDCLKIVLQSLKFSSTIKITDSNKRFEIGHTDTQNQVFYGNKIPSILQNLCETM